MTPEELKKLEDTVGKQASEAIAAKAAEIEKGLDAKITAVKTGLMTEDAFKAFKETEMKALNDMVEKAEKAVKTVGDKLDAQVENARPNSKSIEQFLVELQPKINEAYKNHTFMEFTASQLKAAGVQSIAGTMTPMVNPGTNPYAPGPGGEALEIFDVLRDPNYILDQVDMGRTDRPVLLWANETEYIGAPAEIEEGQEKPQVQHKFQIETSRTKKMAAWVKMTEEFNDDLPQFATKVRRMLQDDVVRGWDNAIQQFVIANAVGYNNPTLNDQILLANYWDALLSMRAQVRVANMSPNSIGIHPNTNVILQTSKNVNGTYLLPPFAPLINGLISEANKVDPGNAFVGDLKQVKVDVYKEFVLRIGWVNDDLIKNQFVTLGEIRYHRYISTARKQGIIYDSLQNVAEIIKGTPHSL